MLTEIERAELEFLRSALNKLLGNEDQYLTPPEASAFLKVGSQYLYKKEVREKIPGVKCGRLLRFRKSDLIKYMEKGAANS